MSEKNNLNLGAVVIPDRTIIVDAGKNAVKVVSLGETLDVQGMVKFPSKVETVKTFQGIRDLDGAVDFMQDDLQHQVVFNNKKYLVGAGMDSSKYSLKFSKTDFHHQLCIYTAIAGIVTKVDEKIELSIGCATSDYVNEQSIEAYRQLIQSSGIIKINVNGIDKSFEIVKLNIYPEGKALSVRALHQGRETHVVDIGGQNVNYRKYDRKGHMLKQVSFDALGINHLEYAVLDDLRKDVPAESLSVESLDIYELINTGRMEELEHAGIDAGRFIVESVQSFLGQVFSKLSSHGLRPEVGGGYVVIFTGGGSLMLERYIRNMYPDNNHFVFSETAQWDNCMSYIVSTIAKKYNELGKSPQELIGKSEGVMKALAYELKKNNF
ncbi:MAG: ParM/StbA family protein [Peptostreptococcaceae bacterium]